ncbi:hypothetical protein CASFOL_027046 [Castilleja foliolosa]|uniref:Uncharacterized protein n=1 Tax=Castilleja foliolosa TaxID=1961234 RepID=A0ABD3CKS8_9LAMI
MLRPIGDETWWSIIRPERQCSFSRQRCDVGAHSSFNSSKYHLRTSCVDVFNMKFWRSNLKKRNSSVTAEDDSGIHIWDLGKLKFPVAAIIHLTSL